MNDGDYTQAIKTARLRSMRLMLINAGEEYKFAKLSCEYGFSVAQATFGGGSDIELTEDQKRRLESAKKRNASSNEKSQVSSTSVSGSNNMDIQSLLLANLLGARKK